MYQKTMWKQCDNVKEVSDEATENYHLNLQAAPLCFTKLWSELQLIVQHDFTVVIHSHRSHIVVFSHSAKQPTEAVG